MLKDFYRKEAGHFQPPAELVRKVSDDKLARDLYKCICVNAYPVEIAEYTIRRLVERKKRDYSFDEVLLRDAIQFIKSNGICKPPRTYISMERAPDEDSGGYAPADFLVNSDLEPLDRILKEETGSLIESILSEHSEPGSPHFAKFNADNVLSEDQRIILRNYLSGEPLTAVQLAASLESGKHSARTVRYLRDKAFDSIRQWLEENGLDEVFKP